MSATMTVPVFDPDPPSSRDEHRDGGFGALCTARGNLPLRSVSVNAKIVGLAAEVRIEQSFENTFAEPLEATYIFPLPDRAAANHLLMQVAGREIVGILKERSEAREEYDRAIAAGHRAAIAEEERPGVFTLRVGNIMPREVARVALTMTVPLSFEDGEGTFRFPLVVAPRYIPGAPLSGAQAGDGMAVDTDAVPDASRISPPVLLPGMPSAVRLAIAVDVDPAGLPLASLRSSLHSLVTSGSLAQGGRITGPVRIEIQPGERLDRDFILRLGFENDALVTSAVVAPSGGVGKQGIFRLTFMPPPSLMRVVKPKDVVFVLDHSGSMGGWKMVAARRAVARMVDTLTAQDRFNVYAFDNDITLPAGWRTEALVPATDAHRFAAVEFLARVEARGGTEMAGPLQSATAALLGLAEEGRERVIVLVTDGQVGNEDQIVAALSRDLERIRVFTVGIDRAVNEGFLRRLATLGAGAMELVEGEARLDEAMDRIHRKLGTPLLTDVSISGEGIDIDPTSLTPDRVAAVFAGCPLEVSGRYTEHAPLDRAAIVVRAKDGTGRRFSQSLAPVRSDNPAIGRLWARSRVRALEDRYAAGGSDERALEAELVQTSLEFSVLCRFTAFVAVDKKEVVNHGGQQHRVTQAVEPASGWDMLASSDADDEAEGSAGEAEQLMSVDAGAMGKRVVHAAKEEAPRAMAAQSAPAPAAVMLPPQASPAASSAAPGAPALAKGKGFLARAIGAVGGRAASVAAKPVSVRLRDKKSDDDAPAAPIPLGAYGRRADELVQASRGLDLGEANAVTLFMIRLRALIDDLRSILSSDALIADLVRTFRRFEDAQARVDIAAHEAKAALEELRQALLGFSAQAHAAPATESGRPSFWKRPPAR